MDEDKRMRQRAVPKKLRVCFPDGTIFCYTSVKETYVQTLMKIGTGILQQTDLEIGHLPIFSKEVYPKYKKWMEPIGDGWYVNTQSDTDQKYRQLYTISQQFGLDLTIDMSADLKGERVSRGSRNIAVLEVTFNDGTVIAEENTTETFMQCIWKIGIGEIQRKNITYGGNTLITDIQKYKGQVQVDADKWLIVPGPIKDKVKVLKVIGVMLNVKMDIFFL